MNFQPIKELSLLCGCGYRAMSLTTAGVTVNNEHPMTEVEEKDTESYWNWWHNLFRVENQAQLSHVLQRTVQNISWTSFVVYSSHNEMYIPFLKKQHHFVVSLRHCNFILDTSCGQIFNSHGHNELHRPGRGQPKTTASSRQCHIESKS